MKWFLLTTVVGLLSANAASAQSAPPNPSAYAPNYYNRANQPLSPYLNLLRGNNTAVNYFYGARPGLPSGGYTGIFQNPTMQRQTFFPQVDTLSDLFENPPEAGKVAPTGHPVGFGNTMGYFGGASPMNRSQQQNSRRNPFGR
jgi:hypothetical protein